MELLIQIVLWGLILTACVWIIIRRVRKFRRGEYCDCCDENCGSCGRPKKPKG